MTKSAYRKPAYSRQELGYVRGLKHSLGNRSDTKIKLFHRSIACNISNAVMASPKSFDRRFLSLKNPDLAAVLFISFGGSTPSVDANNLRLLPNELVTFDTMIPVDEIYVISTVAGSLFIVGEGY